MIFFPPKFQKAPQQPLDGPPQSDFTQQRGYRQQEGKEYDKKRKTNQRQDLLMKRRE